MSFSTNGELLIKDYIPIIKILKLYDAIKVLGFDLTWGLIFTIHYIYLTSYVMIVMMLSCITIFLYKKIHYMPQQIKQL